MSRGRNGLDGGSEAEAAGRGPINLVKQVGKN
jgi:hypothetical protein